MTGWVDIKYKAVGNRGNIVADRRYCQHDCRRHRAVYDQQIQRAGCSGAVCPCLHGAANSDRCNSLRAYAELCGCCLIRRVVQHPLDCNGFVLLGCGRAVQHSNYRRSVSCRSPDADMHQRVCCDCGTARGNLKPRLNRMRTVCLSVNCDGHRAPSCGNTLAVYFRTVDADFQHLCARASRYEPQRNRVGAVCADFVHVPCQPVGCYHNRPRHAAGIPIGIFDGELDGVLHAVGQILPDIKAVIALMHRLSRNDGAADLPRRRAIAGGRIICIVRGRPRIQDRVALDAVVDRKRTGGHAVHKPHCRSEAPASAATGDRPAVSDGFLLAAVIQVQHSVDLLEAEV